MRFPWLVISLVKKKKKDDILTTKTLIIATTHLDRSPDVCGCTGNKNIYVKTIYFHTEKWDNEVFTKCHNNFCIFICGNILPCHLNCFLIANLTSSIFTIIDHSHHC